jgi:DNA-binding MarR family transcriptional regulator
MPSKSQSHLAILHVSPRLLESTLFLMIQVLRDAARLRDLRAPDTKLRFPHRGALACLDEHGPMPQKHLSERLGIDPSDLVTILDELEGWRMITRHRDPADRRRRIVALTPAGRRAAQEHDALVAASNEALLAPLSPRERKTLHGMLARIDAHLLEALRTAPPGRPRGRRRR